MKKGNLLKRGKLIATVGTITVKSFDVKGYRTLTAEFESAVPEASRASIAVKRGNTALSLTPEWKEEGKKVEFKNSAALPEGEYTLVINGEASDKKATVTAEYVKEITILGEKVLTGTSSASKEQGRSNDEAYIYYDVKNNYGESIRNRVTVNWNITSCDTNKERSNRNLGLVVAQRKNDREIFTYGTKISITGTCILGDKNYSQTFEREIGLQQAAQDVVFRGIVNERSDKDKKIESAKVKSEIDSDFTKGTHAVLYQVKDQQGNLIESSRNNLGSATENAKLVLRSKAPKLVQDKFKDGGIFIITDENDANFDQPKYSEYCSANIEPGRFADKGGDVTFTYLATGSGGAADTTYKIGETPRLASFKIEQKAGIVADGDTNVEIPFTAIDTNGNVVEDYKTIARSSNYLNFTASDGILELIEEDNGKAALRWTDAARYTSVSNPYDKSNGIVINDGIIRAVSLTATVESEEGTESRSTILSVSDMRRPEWISNVNYGDDKNDIIIANGNGDNVNIVDDIEYVDQYGEVFNDRKRKSLFWEAALKNNIAGCQYALRLKNLDGNVVSGTPNLSGTCDYSSSSVGAGNTISYSVGSDGILNASIHHRSGFNLQEDVQEAKVSYSVIRRDATSSALGDGNYNRQQWYELGKTTNETYTIVPLSKVSDFRIEKNNPTNKFGIVTALSGYSDGSYNFFADNSSTDSGKDRYNLNEAVSGTAIQSEVPASSATDTNYEAGYDKFAVDITESPYKDYGYTGDRYGNRTISVKSKYKTYDLTVPAIYYASTKDGIWSVKADGTKSDPTSGSSIVLDGNEIVGIVKDRLKWRDLYKVNSARYERQDAELELQILISKDASNGYYKYNCPNGVTTQDYMNSSIIKKDGHFTDDSYNTDGTLLTTKIKVSDALPVANRIIAGDILKKPTNTEIINSNIVNAKLVNQYGCEYNEEKGHSFVYTISNYTENKVDTSINKYNNDTRYQNNYNIIDNKSTNSRIEGAERGDTYKVKVELSNSGLTPQEVTVTVGSDDNAKITSNIGILNSTEYGLRYYRLGYER